MSECSIFMVHQIQSFARCMLLSDNGFLKLEIIEHFGIDFIIIFISKMFIVRWKTGMVTQCFRWHVFKKKERNIHTVQVLFYWSFVCGTEDKLGFEYRNSLLVAYFDIRSVRYPKIKGINVYKLFTSMDSWVKSFHSATKHFRCACNVGNISTSNRRYQID